MKIAHSTRVVYKNNPLAEVICQLRFERLPDFEDQKIRSLCDSFFTLGYTNVSEELSFGFQQQFGPDGQVIQAPVAIPKIRIHHCTSRDGIWRVSFCPEFIAITCQKYAGWDGFFERVLAVVSTFMDHCVDVNGTRLGLRYRDVIEREAIGLEGVPWHELIQPFLLGPVAPDALSDMQVAQEADVISFMSQTQLKIDDSLLLLQSSVMSSIDGQRQAFLIDADFFHENALGINLVSGPVLLADKLKKLHINAGALFRRCIRERLHHALDPII